MMLILLSVIYLDLATINANQITLGDTIWVTDTDNKSWTIAQLTNANVNVTSS